MSCTLSYGGNILGENLCFHIQGRSEDTLKVKVAICSETFAYLSMKLHGVTF